MNVFCLDCSIDPPNSDINYYLDIENSLHLAIDTDIPDIIVTGDFNFNMLSPLNHSVLSFLFFFFSVN